MRDLRENRTILGGGREGPLPWKLSIPEGQNAGHCWLGRGRQGEEQIDMGVGNCGGLREKIGDLRMTPQVYAF